MIFCCIKAGHELMFYYPTRIVMPGFTVASSSSKFKILSVGPNGVPFLISRPFAHAPMHPRTLALPQHSCTLPLLYCRVISGKGDSFITTSIGYTPGPIHLYVRNEELVTAKLKTKPEPPFSIWKGGFWLDKG